MAGHSSSSFIWVPVAAVAGVAVGVKYKDQILQGLNQIKAALPGVKSAIKNATAKEPTPAEGTPPAEQKKK